MKKKSISAKEFDSLFEQGEDITGYLDLEDARRHGLETRRVSVDLPQWMINRLDREAGGNARINR
jgi:hypothetical protein